MYLYIRPAHHTGLYVSNAVLSCKLCSNFPVNLSPVIKISFVTYLWSKCKYKVTMQEYRGLDPTRILGISEFVANSSTSTIHCLMFLKLILLVTSKTMMTPRAPL